MTEVIQLTRPKHLIPDHELRELVNDLRDIAVKYHDHGCLRELISSRVTEALERYKPKSFADELLERNWQSHIDDIERERKDGETDISPA